MSSIFKEINAVNENKMENPGQYVVIPLSTENIISQKSWKLWEKRKKDDPERDNVTQLNLNQPYSALRWQIVGTRSSAGKLQASFTLCIHLVSFPALKWRKIGISKTLWHIYEQPTLKKQVFPNVLFCKCMTCFLHIWLCITHIPFAVIYPKFWDIYH